MKTVQSSRSVVCSNRCNICFFEKHFQTNSLLTCQGCKLVSYCGGNHQKLDWPIHKIFCKAIQSILKTNNINHPHLIHGSINSKLDFQKAVINLKRILILALGRNLESYEEEYVNCPRYCNKCLNLKTFKSYDCMKCHIVSYCSLSCQQKDAEFHSKDCSNLKIYYNFWQESVINFKFKTNYFHIDWKTIDLFDLLKKVGTSTVDIPKIVTDQDSFQKFASACDFSNVSTILFVLNYCQFMHNLHNNCTIYIVGARDDFYFFQEPQCTFLISQLPNILKLNLCFIGPELLRVEPIVYNCYADQKKKEIKLDFFKERFENYVERKKFNLTNDIFTNLIICFNCGFSEFSNSKTDTWRQALDIFIKIQRTPIAFTSYTKFESKLDLKEICLTDIETTAQIMIKCEKNLFRDYRPIRNWEISDESDNIFHRNNYISVIMPKPNTVQARAIKE